MSRITLTSLSVGAMFTLVGCGASHETVGGAEPTGAETANSVSVSGSVLSLDGPALGGVEVCTRPGHSISEVDCTTSASDGSWTLSGLPAKGQVALTFEKQGFEPALRVFQTGTDDLTLAQSDARLVPLSEPTGMGMPTGASVGRLEFFIDTGSSEASLPQSVSLVGTDGRSLHAIPGTHGNFVNLEADEYMLIVRGDCVANGLYGYPLFEDPDVLSDAAIVAVPVVEGYATTPVRVTCKGAAAPVKL